MDRQNVRYSLDVSQHENQTKRSGLFNGSLVIGFVLEKRDVHSEMKRDALQSRRMQPTKASFAVFLVRLLTGEQWRGQRMMQTNLN